MNKIKSLRFILLFLLVILVLVVVRSTNKNLFKKDAKNAVTAIQKNNSVSLNQLNKLTGEYLIIDLSSSENYISGHINNSIHIPFENLLEKKNREILGQAKSEIILYSEDISTASKAWVILNQLDYKNVFILDTEGNNDVLKYKFQPDTVSRLE